MHARGQTWRPWPPACPAASCAFAGSRCGTLPPFLRPLPVAEGVTTRDEATAVTGGAWRLHTCSNSSVSAIANASSSSPPATASSRASISAQPIPESRYKSTCSIWRSEANLVSTALRIGGRMRDGTDGAPPSLRHGEQIATIGTAFGCICSPEGSGLLRRGCAPNSWPRSMGHAPGGGPTMKT